jgi:hypothetical protein
LPKKNGVPLNTKISLKVKPILYKKNNKMINHLIKETFEEIYLYKTTIFKRQYLKLMNGFVRIPNMKMIFIP